MSGLVSIIVPVYQAQDYIVQTITMVGQQTYGNWELVLVDDKSKDGSVEAIKKAPVSYTHLRAHETSV